MLKSSCDDVDEEDDDILELLEAAEVDVIFKGMQGMVAATLETGEVEMEPLPKR